MCVVCAHARVSVLLHTVSANLHICHRPVFHTHTRTHIVMRRAVVLLDPGCAYSLRLVPDLASDLLPLVLAHLPSLWLLLQVRTCV